MLKGYTVSLCSNHGRGDTIEFNFVLLLLVNISPELYNFLMQLVYVNSLKLVNIHHSSSHISVPNAYILTGP